jgi:hypothetical protein
MRRDFILKLCYTLSFTVALLAYPVKNYSSIVSNKYARVEKVEHAVTEAPTETLHGELLFR